MIQNYSQYVERYMRRLKKDPPAPGEHHFVASYLVPRLLQIDGTVPDYINPDGTKGIFGDVVYYENAQHHYGIEVKLGTVRLTKREFNHWVVNANSQRWPNLFVGVGLTGIAICSWQVFRSSYVTSVQAKRKKWKPEAIRDGYGPMKNIDQLKAHLPKDAWFPTVEAALADDYEQRFLEALRGYRCAA
jgi:hypothetical protein